jgi:integral membrane protein (TIGR01906 family)
MVSVVNRFVNILLALCLSISLLISAINTTVAFKSLYYMDIKPLNIEASSGRSCREIKETYSYIIDYITDKKQKNFEMPNFKFSSSGEIHFTEVKKMLSNMNMLNNLLILLSFLILSFFHNHIDSSFLKNTPLILLSLISTLLIEFAMDFNRIFTAFHKVFFKNDYWLFDINKDPVINILPESFFLHCAIFIVMLLVTASICLLLLQKMLTPQG